MTHASDGSASLRSLLAEALDGHPTAESWMKLQQRLKTDPEARAEYLRHALLDSLLAEELAAGSVADMVDVLGTATVARGSLDPGLGEASSARLARSPAGAATKHGRASAALRTAWSWRTARPWAWRIGGAIAAAAVLVALGVVYFQSHEASAAVLLLQETLRIHSLPVDRCYLVEVRSVAGDSGVPWPSRVDRLWTRGDHFFFESVNERGRWAWGREQNGSVWLAYGTRHGLRFEADEVPPQLALRCEQMSMCLESLLHNVLADFDLHWDSARDDTGRLTKIVRAVGRPQRRLQGIQEARLEIDAETKVVRRLELDRVWWASWGGTVTYTLVDSQPQADSQYQLTGHLQEPYEVFSRDHRPQRRREILEWLFGSPFLRWRQQEHQP